MQAVSPDDIDLTAHQAVQVALSIHVNKTMQECDAIAQNFITHLESLGYEVVPHMK